MIILKVEKQKFFKESDGMPIQQFYKLVGNKTMCRASWASKPGFTTVSADPPAFCGINNGFFYIAVRDGLSVNFQLRSLISIRREHYDDGTPDDYQIVIRDGTVINLNLL